MKRRVIIHKYEFDDPNVFVFPFIYLACRGGHKTNDRAGVYQRVLTFVWENVTCKSCLKVKPRRI